jgi:hypothetical protein
MKTMDFDTDQERKYRTTLTQNDELLVRINELKEENEQLLDECKIVHQAANGEHDKVLKLKAQLTPETSSDALCVEDDGCPTEGAVLKREWRKLTAQLKIAYELADQWDESAQLTGDAFTVKLTKVYTAALRETFK